MANALELQYLTNSMDSLSRALLGRRMRLDKKEQEQKRMDLQKEILQSKKDAAMVTAAYRNKTVEERGRHNLAMESQGKNEWLSKQIDNVAEGVEKGFVDPEDARKQLIAGLQGADENEKAILSKLPKFNLLLNKEIKPLSEVDLTRFHGSGETGDLREAESWYKKSKEAEATGDAERAKRYMEYHQLAKKSAQGYSVADQAIFYSLVKQLRDIDEQMRELKMSGTSADEIESSQREFNVLKKDRDRVKREIEELRRGTPVVQPPQPPPSSGITPPPPALNTDIKTNAAGTTTMPIEGIIGPSETKKLKFNPLTGKIE